MYTTYRDYNLYSGLPTTEIIEPINLTKESCAQVLSTTLFYITYK